MWHLHCNGQKHSTQPHYNDDPVSNIAVISPLAVPRYSDCRKIPDVPRRDLAFMWLRRRRRRLQRFLCLTSRNFLNFWRMIRISCGAT